MTNEKIKLALIVDNQSVSKWQADALDAISDLVEVVFVLNCTNTANKKRIWHNGMYYALNMASIKNPLTRKRPLNFDDSFVVDFDSRYEGSWQWIPDDVIAQLAEKKCYTMLKFGMSLLKTDNLVGFDVLSFHHGDPRQYRGRPVGFYELLHNAECVGLIVQKLSNILDGGEVLAIGYAKTHKYSYRKTIQEIYRSSPALLRRALINHISGKNVDILPIGKNYRLPSNWLVVKFCVRLLTQKVKRLIYGALWEKRWNIMVAEDVNPVATTILTIADKKYPIIPAKYNFYADPFFSADGTKIRTEALLAATGLGEIVELDVNSLKITSTLLAGPHFSYPYTFLEKDSEYLLPEVSSHEAPYLFDLSGVLQKIPLRGLENLRLVDPSLVKADGRYWLFGGHPETAATMLQLYSADSIDGPYIPHSMNPIVISPLCARMGGRLLVHEGKLYRFGQNNADAYGNGIRVMEVVKLSRDNYEEQEVAQLRFSDAHGPHTVDVRNGKVVVDFYIDRFSFLAGYRRFASRLYRWRRPS